MKGTAGVLLSPPNGPVLKRSCLHPDVVIVKGGAERQRRRFPVLCVLTLTFGERRAKPEHSQTGIGR